MRKRHLALVCGSVLALAALMACGAPPPVLVIDDFTHGIDKWRNEDAGKLESVADADTGNRYLRWTAVDDGIGHIILKALDRKEIDFSQYDLLQFRYCVAGKAVWNINPIIQQYPFMQGYRELYYSLDTLDIQLGAWQTYTQDLRLVENSWPDTFSRDKQEFQFEIHQLAGAGQTEFRLDDVTLLKNMLGIARTYAGQWRRDADGGQSYLFSIPVHNTDTVQQQVTAALVPGTAKNFRVEIDTPSVAIPPKGEAVITVTVRIPAAVVAKSAPFAGEMIKLVFGMESCPALRLETLLPCGVRPEVSQHPAILCSPERAKVLAEQYRDPVTRKTLDPVIVNMVKSAPETLKYQAEYPPCANQGVNICAVDKTKLEEVPVPNLPESTYQCPECGRFYRGMMYDAAMKGWYAKHRRNAEIAQRAAIAYLLTRDQAYAEKTAEILRGYIDTYEKMPVAGLAVSVHTQIASSGASRIGGSYMQEKSWLASLAIALDCIWDSGVLSPAEKDAIRAHVFVPSATLIMDHRVGLMNLQWMINGAAAFAGIASDDAGVTARAVYGDHGVIALMTNGYLTDGLWRENPSYNNVMANEGYAIISTLLNRGIMPYTAEMDKRFKAPWLLAAPDGRFPTLGTGGPPNLTIFFNGVKSIAKLSHDPEIAWIDRQRPTVQPLPYLSAQVAAFQAEGTTVPADQVQPITQETLVLPDYGVVALRSPNSDMYAALNFGRHLVHGHFNKLSLNAYGKGGWYIRNVWGGYGENFADFLEPTSSASTIMVDGKRQDADTGELLFQQSTPLAEIASAREIGAWKDVEHERTIVQTAGWLLMLDRCLSATPHRYDWLYHSQNPGKGADFAWTTGPETKGAVTTLGDEACYRYFLPAEALQTATASMVVRYTRPDTSGLQMTLLGEAGASLFRTHNSSYKYEGLMYRKLGTNVSYQALFEPLGKNETAQATLTAVALTTTTGRAVTVQEAQAAQVETAVGKWVVVVNYAGIPLKTKAGLAIPGTERVVVLPVK